MKALLPWIGVLLTVLAGYALIKRKQTNMVLLLTGLAMLVIAVLFGVTNFLPKGVKPSGFVGFDIFTLLKTISTKQISGTGFLIMTAGGFAGYMDKIGAANALVKVCTAPLKKLSQPYLVLVLAYIIGQFLIAVIPSAAGLAMLLLVALYPILKGVGLSPGAAAAVIGTSGGMTFAPTAGTANLAAKTAGIDPIVYLAHYQVPLAIVGLVTISVAHFFVQRYYDKKNDEVYAEAKEIKTGDIAEAPLWYAIFPILPIALMIIFSKLVYSQIKLETNAALLLVWVLVILIELVRWKFDTKRVFSDAMTFYKKMGGMFASIVALIICAEFFASGLKATGVIAMLIHSANGIGMGMGGMTAVLTAIVGSVTFLTGSGVGAYSSFAALAPDVANALGGSIAGLVTPMQFASGMLRAMSPVAGVVIAIAGATGLSPMALVRRTWIPMMVGMVSVLIANWILFL